MIDRNKSREELLEEVKELRRRVAELEEQHSAEIRVEEPPSRVGRYLVDGKYGIRDLVDLEALRKVFRAFSTATGFITGLVDYPMQKVLIGAGWRDVCTKFHRAFPGSMRRCKKSNSLLTEKLVSQRRQSISECENGLIIGATPIIIKGVHIASIKTGQVFFGRPHLEYFREQAQSLGYDPEEYLQSLNSVPVVSEIQLQGMLSFLSEFATMIVELGMNNLEIREALFDLEQEIRERKRTEQILIKSKDELRRLSSRLLIAQEDERKRVAAELHDSLGSHLTTVRFALESARKRLAEQAADTSGLDISLSQVQGIADEIRKIWMDLRPTILDKLGLLPALEWFIDQHATALETVNLVREFNFAEDEIPDALKIVIYRIVQEALNNIARHSKADWAVVTLARNQGNVELIIEDNGVGFDPEAVASSTVEDRGIGLTSMKERTELSGGSFNLASASGKGVKIMASWPACPTV